jgi:hypothetical protein
MSDPPGRQKGLRRPHLGQTASAILCRKPVGFIPFVASIGTTAITVQVLLYNGVTRASRIARLALGTLIPIELIGLLPRAYASEPKIGDLLP